MTPPDISSIAMLWHINPEAALNLADKWNASIAIITGLAATVAATLIMRMIG